MRKQSFIEKLIEGSLNQKELTISDLLTTETGI